MPSICLINPNTSVATTELMAGLARSMAAPGTSITGMTARSGAPLITDPAALREAALAVAALAEQISADGVVVAAFGDPGVVELQRLLSVPVIGIGEVAVREAAAGGRRFSIATTTPLLEGSIRANVAALGFAGQLASVRISRQDPASLTADPLELEAVLQSLVDRCIADDGADAIIIGGGPLSAAARAISDRVSIVIIEPVPVAVAWMERLLDG